MSIKGQSRLHFMDHSPNSDCKMSKLTLLVVLCPNIVKEGEVLNSQLLLAKDLVSVLPGSCCSCLQGAPILVLTCGPKPF